MPPTPVLESGCLPRIPPLSSAPYAEIHRAQQDAESRVQAVQNYRNRQGFASARLAPAFALDQERQEKAPHGEIRRRR